MFLVVVCVFFFKQKTAYEMRISDWSSDVCSSDLLYYDVRGAFVAARGPVQHRLVAETDRLVNAAIEVTVRPTILPRTVLIVRIDGLRAVPAAFGSRLSATRTVEAAPVRDGDVIAEVSCSVAAYGLRPETHDTPRAA